jgi:hypothetical protein
MNKYLKTYIRSREIELVYNGHMEVYELDYIDINKILDKNNYYYNLMDNYNIWQLLHNTKQPDILINKLLDNKNFVNDLNLFGIMKLIKYTTDPYNLINLLRNKGVYN